MLAFANIEHTIAHLFVVIVMLAVVIVGAYTIWKGEQRRRQQEKHRR